MPVEDALVRARVPKHRTVEVPEVGVDGRERGDRVALAQNEEVLSAPRWIDDVEVHEPAVVERHERDRGGERAARVEALVHGVAALLEAEQPDVGVLDGEKLENALTEEVVFTGGRGANGRPPIECARLWVHPAASVSTPSFWRSACS